MVGHGGSSAGSYLADPTSPIPFHCASIVVTSTLRAKMNTSAISLLLPVHRLLHHRAHNYINSMLSDPSLHGSMDTIGMQKDNNSLL